MPDLDTIKRLSQILEFNFFTVEGLSGGAPEASLAKKPPKKRNVRRLILAAAGAVLLLAAAFARPSAGWPNVGREAEGERPDHADGEPGVRHPQ